jgi:hypothetical protein
MARYVSFKTTRFDNTTVKPHFINPTTGFGEDAVVWLLQNIQHPAVTLDQPIQEDYGWGVWSNVNDAPYWIAVSINEETIGKDVAEWFMIISYERGCNPFRRVRPALGDDLLLICQQIDAALYNDSTISDIQWWESGFYVGESTAHPE